MSSSASVFLRLPFLETNLGMIVGWVLVAIVILVMVSLMTGWPFGGQMR